jgi:hypothetical protein
LDGDEELTDGRVTRGHIDRRDRNTLGRGLDGERTDTAAADIGDVVTRSIGRRHLVDTGRASGRIV